MANPLQRPTSDTQTLRLSSTGVAADVAAALPLGIYAQNQYFLSGAAEQVAYCYKALSGDILDIEIKDSQVYAAYEDSVLTYSYLVNLHQAKNSIGNLLGAPTGTFDQNGNLISGSAMYNAMSGTAGVSMMYPQFDISMITDIGDAFSHLAGVGGKIDIYSASLNVINGQQDYDLQDIVYSASLDPSSRFYGQVGGSKIKVNKVYFKTPSAMWRFYGFYGGLNAVGNLSTFGQYSDDSTFEVIPVWQNKLQAMAFEDAIYTRCSHYSYEVKNNHLRLFPAPNSGYFGTDGKIWFEFSVGAGTGANIGLGALTGSGANSTFSAIAHKDPRIYGVNNINSLPFSNIPYENINAIGKHWIRKYCLALVREMLGEVRSKFSTVPIPGDNVTLNGPALIAQAKDEKESLKTELLKILEDTNYAMLAQQKADISELANKTMAQIPNVIFVG